MKFFIFTNYIQKRFFSIYNEWTWETSPIQIETKEPQLELFTKFNNEQWFYLPERESMMILTLNYPIMNSSHSVSPITLKIIRKHLKTANEQVQNILRKKKDWKEILIKYNFFKEYNHFLQISIVGQKKEEFAQWRGHVESKLRKLTKCFEHENVSNELDIHPYPIPIINKDEEFNYSVSYYYGLKAIFVVKNREEKIVDLRGSMHSFMNYLEGFKKNPDDISLKITHLKKKDIPKHLLEMNNMDYNTFINL